MDIILASGSPRRKELLKGLDIDFRIHSISLDEAYPIDLPVENVAIYLADLKFSGHEFLFEKNPDAVIITADTIVLLDGEILGKPKERQEAIEMLKKLSNKKHTVITGVCIGSQSRKILFDQATHVWFRSLNQYEIEYYVDHYNPIDKAGSYGIQEWIGFTAIKKMNGCFYNVMGLPVMRVYLELKNLGAMPHLI